MKRKILVAAAFAMLAMVVAGCSSFRLKEPEDPAAEATGSITFSVGELVADYYPDGEILKSNVKLDTNDFILTIYSTLGTKIYDGKYGARPQEISVTPGGYEIALHSKRFNPPMLDSPVFGEEKTVVVASNEQVKVSFMCRQTNAGVRFQFDKSFKNRFPGSGVYIRQGNNHLAYDYTQTKYAYVACDPFTLVYSNSGKDTVLLEKSLVAGQMIDMKLSYSTSKTTASVFKVDVDTTRQWISYNFNVGLQIPAGAVTIEEAKLMVGEKNVSVFGYIFGGDPTTTTVRVGPPFESKSSLVIAPSMSERNRNNMFVVELPSGSVRDALNLVVNSDNLGRPVVITGTIVASYYGYVGIKNTKSYTLL